MTSWLICHNQTIVTKVLVHNCCFVKKINGMLLLTNHKLKTNNVIPKEGINGKLEYCFGVNNNKSSFSEQIILAAVD